MPRVALMLRRVVHDFIRSRSANFTTLTALTMPVMLMFAAFAVDTGSLYVERRELQALADIGALTAAANISEAERAAALVLSDNGKVGLAARAVDPENQFREGMMVEMGRYSADPDIPVPERFVAGAALRTRCGSSCAAWARAISRRSSWRRRKYRPPP